MKISKEDAEKLERRVFNPKPDGKAFVLTVNGAPVSFLNTESAVAADYLFFLDGVVRAVLNDRDNLEREANRSGRTINGHAFSGIGSVSIPKVADK